jgi:hypothetical protein
MTPLHLSDLSPALRQRLGLAPGTRRSKFNARRTVVDGERFDSQREAQRFGELRYRETAGEIENLQRQPQYLITINGAVGAVYTADFRYVERRSRTWVVEDSKGGNATKTEAYRLRKRLVEAQYEIDIQEV